MWQKIRLVPRTLYNPDAVAQLDRLLNDYTPDVAHVHNIYHYLTPAIFPVLKKHGVPIVFKLSDYHAVCPNYALFAHGEIDHSCEKGHYYKLLCNKSIGNSWSESFVGMMEGYVNAWKKYYDCVDLFVAPSDFMKELCVSYGIPREKIVVLRNVLNFDAYDLSVPVKENIFLYMGRIAEEKGLTTLVDAMHALKDDHALDNWRCVIAGKGPQEKALQRYIVDRDVQDVVRLAGFCPKGGDAWKKWMRSASVAVLPSVWYDNSPIAISESMAFHTPVIVSDRGGTKEMIEDGTSGFVFRATDSADLAQKMRRFIDNDTLIDTMGAHARERVMQLNNTQKYYETLMEIYGSVISNQ
ncbi:MAG: hypothetical protein CR954_00485 [Candidatus Moraniibacteriota bacterium]|nr:MAG: hypothetical protein CR954_00485 [Candidatus Moranbacteria bacterium]